MMTRFLCCGQAKRRGKVHSCSLQWSDYATNAMFLLDYENKNGVVAIVDDLCTNSCKGSRSLVVMFVLLLFLYVVQRKAQCNQRFMSLQVHANYVYAFPTEHPMVKVLH